MATMRITDQALHVRFSTAERLAVRRGGLDVPLSSIRSVERFDNGLSRTRGGRIGFLVSGFTKVGVWGIGTGRRQLVSVRRDVPALRIAVTGGPFDELLISTRDADRIVAEVRAA